MKATFIVIMLGMFLSCESKEVEPTADCVAKPNANCICTMQYDPVCGCDGKTYGNACEAACAGIQVVSKGACTGR